MWYTNDFNDVFDDIVYWMPRVVVEDDEDEWPDTRSYLTQIAAPEPDLLAFVDSMRQSNMCLFDVIISDSPNASIPNVGGYYGSRVEKVTLKFTLPRTVLFLNQNNGTWMKDWQRDVPNGSLYRSSVVPCGCTQSCPFDVCVYEVQYWTELRRSFITACVLAL
jgi:hypothetical protein